MTAGRIAFLPWVTLPYSVRIGGFRFVPTPVDKIGELVGHALADSASKAVRTHVDQSGKPIESCTLIMRLTSDQPWSIGPKHWRAAAVATEMLALSCLSEQQFMVPFFQPHLNASMFRGENFHIAEGSEDIGIQYARRGGGLRVSGRKFSSTIFQQPMQIEGTECKVVNIPLAKALRAAERQRLPLWERIASSLDVFLLGHAEQPELSLESTVMMSAMAFERLLGPANGALDLSEKFAALWATFPSTKVIDARRVRPDAKYLAAQQQWPVRQKWMKELYEARSSAAHNGPSANFTTNWTAEKHMVIAAFVYPLTIKIMLRNAGLYPMLDEEIVACEVLDQLLDSDWGKGWQRPPQWNAILTEAIASMQIGKIIKGRMKELAPKYQSVSCEGTAHN